jgi:hypothetical protein
MNTTLFYKTWKSINHRQLSAADFLLYAIAKSEYSANKIKFNPAERNELLAHFVFSAFQPKTNRICLLNGHQPFIKLNKAINDLFWQIHLRTKAAERGELDLVQGKKLSDTFALQDLYRLKECLSEIQKRVHIKTDEIFAPER